MMRCQCISAPLLISLALLSACSPASKKEARIYQAGEKATVGPLTYSVVDAQRAASLGNDPTNMRTPQNRFYIIEIAVSNSGNENVSIPGMSLVDDSGKAYPELGDGTGVQNWLGVVRSVAPAQTDQGNVVFDAPLGHYRLRLTEDGDDDVSIDLPVSFIRDAGPPLPDTSQTELPKQQ